MKWALIVVAIVAAIIGLVAIIGASLPKAHRASRSARFRQPPQAVWDTIVGPPSWRSDLSGFEQLPPRDGHRAWKEIDKHGGAVTYASEEEIPATRLVTRITDPNLPYGGRWILEIAPLPDGCLLQITEEGEIYNPIFRFVSRFVLGYTGTMDNYLKELRAKFGETNN